MCNDREAFRKNSLGPARATVRLGDESVLKVAQQGLVMVNRVELATLFIPEFRVSLLSVAQLDSQGLMTVFSEQTCRISDVKGRAVIQARLSRGLYRFQGADTESEEDGQLAEAQALLAIAAGRKQSSRQPVESALWHRRLAHLNPASMDKILDWLPHKDVLNSACDICLRAKSKQQFTRTKAARSSTHFELVHSDLCGPFKPSAGGSIYYLLYIDDCTRYTEVYFLRSKAAIAIIPKFREYKAWVENQGFRIRRFRCDNGRGEFDNEEFRGILSESGITYEPAPPYSQHKNGVSERMIQTINTKARCMLLDAKLQVRFWAEAIRTAVYIHRRSPTSSLPDSRSPYEMLYGSRPQLHHLRRFGCTVYRHIPKEQREGKFTDRGRACMMLGYVHQTTKIWRIWDFSGKGRAVESSNVVFVEHENAVSWQAQSHSIGTSTLGFPGDSDDIPALPVTIGATGAPRGLGDEVTLIKMISPEGRYTPQGMVMPAGSKIRPESQDSMYLPTLGDELGPQKVQPRAERCVMMD